MSRGSPAGRESPKNDAERYSSESRKGISRRAFLGGLGGTALGATLAGSGGLFYASEAVPEWVETVRVSLSVPRLSPEFGGYKMVHVSDLHLDDHLEPDYLDEIIGRVNGEDPDLIAVTGDFVTFSARRFARELSSILSGLRAADGVFAVLGNHDYRTDPEVVRSALRRAGIRELQNDAYSLRRGGSSLHVCGVDDVWEGRPDLGRVVNRLPAEGSAVLLAHEPDFADISARTGCFDLQLSGHSHGGQVRLPLVGAPVLPEYAEKYPIGLYEIGGMRLYTNRGLGMLPPRFRFLCRPEITVLTLEPGRL